MAKKRIPEYGIVTNKGHIYYRTVVEDENGKKVAIYANTQEELYVKELDTLDRIESATFRHLRTNRQNA